MNDQMRCTDFLKQVITLIDKDSRLIQPWNIKLGQFVIAFLVVPNDALKQVGYITQVRTGIGQVPNEQEVLSLRMNALLHWCMMSFNFLGYEE